MSGSRPPAVARVLERMTATCREHELFLPGETVMVSVSGGPDSTCLLLALVEVRRLFKLHLEVFHFDHRLRADSRKDAAYAKRTAGRLNLPFHLREAASKPAKGDSVEDWAHRARRTALALTMRDAGASKGAIGHTRDDRAETLLIAALRGGGLDALAGLRPIHGPYVRPLLDVTREDVEAYCRAARVRPRTDETNRDTNLLRNAVRLEVLPAIAAMTGRDARDPLARSAALLREDADELTRMALDAEQDVLDEESEGVALAAAALDALPKALASRVVRSALYRVGFLPSVEMIEAVLDLAAGRPGRSRDLPKGLRATRDRGYVHLPRTSPEDA